MNGQLAETIRKMPPALQQEVEDFVFFLSKRQRLRSTRRLRQDWAGALKGQRDAYTSLVLQKKALEWRTE